MRLLKLYIASIHFFSTKCVMHRVAQSQFFHALNTTLAKNKKIILKDFSDPVLVPHEFRCPTFLLGPVNLRVIGIYPKMSAWALF